MESFSKVQQVMKLYSMKLENRSKSTTLNLTILVILLFLFFLTLMGKMVRKIHLKQGTPNAPKNLTKCINGNGLSESISNSKWNIQVYLNEKWFPYEYFIFLSKIEVSHSSQSFFTFTIIYLQQITQHFYIINLNE